MRRDSIKENPWDAKCKPIQVGKIKCKHCGHTVLLNNQVKTVCSWCGYYVYKNDLEEFKDRLINELKGIK